MPNIATTVSIFAIGVLDLCDCRFEKMRIQKNGTRADFLRPSCQFSAIAVPEFAILKNVSCAKVCD